MKTIQYRIVWADGDFGIVEVKARTINSGFRKAVALALTGTAEIARIEFWMIP